MRYWDSSALVPLVISESSSGAATGWLGADPAIVTWVLSPVEIASALHRRIREGGLPPATVTEARRRLEALRAAWIEIRDPHIVGRRAERLLGVHPLRAADALQLAAALIACDERPERLTFACLDVRLAAAARAEGFEVLG